MSSFHQLLTAYYLVIGCVLLLLLASSRWGGISSPTFALCGRRRPSSLAEWCWREWRLGWRATAGDDIILSLLQTPYWVNIPYAVIGTISALMVWHVSAMWNDLSDRQTDDKRPGRLVAAGMVRGDTFLSASLVLLAVSLLLASLLSWQNVVLIGILAVLAYIYSFPPLRLKRHAMSSLLIGLGTAMAFISGYITPFSEVAGFEGSDVHYLTGTVISAPLDPFALILAFFAFLGLVIGSMITDIDGHEEDRRAGVRTIYTAIGVERGTMVVSAAIFLASFAPLILLPAPQDLIVLISLGAAGAFMFWKRRTPRPVMLVAAVGLLYAALRFVLG